MTVFSACKCGEDADGKQWWCVCLHGSPIEGFGKFDSKADAEAAATIATKKAQLIEDRLCDQIEGAKIKVPENIQYSGAIAKIVNSPETHCVHFIQKIGREPNYVMHALDAKIAADLAEGQVIGIQYQKDGTLRLPFLKGKNNEIGR